MKTTKILTLLGMLIINFQLSAQSNGFIDPGSGILNPGANHSICLIFPNLPLCNNAILDCELTCSAQRNICYLTAITPFAVFQCDNAYDICLFDCEQLTP